LNEKLITFWQRDSAPGLSLRSRNGRHADRRFDLSYFYASSLDRPFSAVLGFTGVFFLRRRSGRNIYKKKDDQRIVIDELSVFR